MLASFSDSLAVPSTVAVPFFALPNLASSPQDSQRRVPGYSALVDVRGKHLYFVGIGGSGMSGLAQLLALRGALISGSDKEASAVTQSLGSLGIGVSFDQSGVGLPTACEMVIASAAIQGDHAELVAAAARGITVVSYAWALGQAMQSSTGIAVAGTHGKSTTTAMLGCALVDAGLDPSVIVGATCPQLPDGALAKKGAGAGYRCGALSVPRGALAGAPGLLVAEACEYNRSFHHFRARFACINNIEADHLDVYGTLDQVVASFREFASFLPPQAEGGRLLIGHEGSHRREVTAGLACGVETIGFHPDADWCVGYEPSTREVTVMHGGKLSAKWTNTLAGAHNASNAATAYVLGLWAGGESQQLALSLAKFAGADRRMQFLGERAAAQGGGTVRVFDDYGHHPTEIEVTLRAFRESEAPQLRGGRLIVVFQPHQHSRTRHLLEEFAASFEQADMVVVPHIYFVRDSEEERQRVSASDLVQRLQSKGVNALHLDPLGAIVEHLGRVARGGDVVVVMGAGDVWRVGVDFVRGTSTPVL